ncbi:hypothetical protein ACGFX8_12070 [Streptomyces sp. NPDC048362]|uniref:hypothetical protein n=1 Tax=Streptomyces sp. NPDC048362 TaxID=3365539 RepID=UPI00371215E9
MLTALARAGHDQSAWPTPGPPSPRLLGAAMPGTAPALSGISRTTGQQEARTLVPPPAVHFAVSLINADRPAGRAFTRSGPSAPRTGPAAGPTSSPGTPAASTPGPWRVDLALAPRPVPVSLPR